MLDFIEVATRGEHMDLQLEEVVIDPRSTLVAKTVAASRLRDSLNVIVVAIKRKGTEMIFNPPDDAQLQACDTLVMLGAREQLDRVERMAKG